MTRNSFNKRVRFWSISRDVKKVTKIGHFKAKLIPKTILFGDQKKRHYFEGFRRCSRGAGRPAGRMRVTFCLGCQKNDKKWSILRRNWFQKRPFLRPQKTAPNRRLVLGEAWGCPAGRPDASDIFVWYVKIHFSALKSAKIESHKNVVAAKENLRSQKSTPKARSCSVCLFKKEHFLSIWDHRISRKNDSKRSE